MGLTLIKPESEGGIDTDWFDLSSLA